MPKRISVAQPTFLGNETRYVNECLESGWISSAGSFIERFEAEVADRAAVRCGVACSSGTTALHLALEAMGVREGDEVIVPSVTFVATGNAVKYCGAAPVLIDCLQGSFNIDPEKVEESITSKTRGIVVVHLYGWPVEMDAIRKIADKHGLFVLEDAAEALGAQYKGRPAGSLGHAATFSFYGNKIITTGEGGMVVTDSTEVAEEVRLLRGQAMDPGRRYWFSRVGYNYRLTNLQAAVGLGQIECLNQHLITRQEIASAYRQLLQGQAAEFLEVPRPPEHVRHAYWMYVVTLRGLSGLSRDRVAELMARRGVETRPVFYPLHQLPPFRDDRSYPVADDVSSLGLTLPTHGGLTSGDIEYVVEALVDACKESIVSHSTVLK